MGVGCFAQKRGGGYAGKTPFLFWRFFALLTGRGWAAAICPAGGDPSPQRTRNDCTAQAARQTTPRTSTHARTLDTLHREIRTAAGLDCLHSVSETVQICTHSNMNDFQHKNVCKTIDINTRTCYYIDNTRTCYTTTKQEDKKP